MHVRVVSYMGSCCRDGPSKYFASLSIHTGSKFKVLCRIHDIYGQDMIHREISREEFEARMILES